ncbi:MAG: hypothetical protein Q9159_003097 [Coniocarpon cinnabarinum]
MRERNPLHAHVPFPGHRQPPPQNASMAPPPRPAPRHEARDLGFLDLQIANTNDPMGDLVKYMNQAYHKKAGLFDEEYRCAYENLEELRKQHGVMLVRYRDVIDRYKTTYASERDSLEYGERHSYDNKILLILLRVDKMYRTENGRFATDYPPGGKRDEASA